MSTKSPLDWNNLLSFLHPWLNDAIASLGFQKMTPVQASTIPLLSTTKDVIVESVTGSGKTLAFVIPVLHKLSYHLQNQKVKKGHFCCVVLSPTRELACQIQGVFSRLLEFMPEDLPPITTQLLVGSSGTVRDDLDSFMDTQPQILIATPGRFLDFISSNKVKLSSVDMVILDEADKLLDISFSRDVITILQRLPKQRRTGLFSATLSAAGDTIFKTGMANPVRVTVRGSKELNPTPSSLHILYALVKPHKKITTVLELCQSHSFKKAMVYFPTCTSVKYFYMVFKSLLHKEFDEVKFHSLHGQLSTKSRLKALDNFTSGDTILQKHVLMTTDVAARGIDVPDVDLVIHIDPPTDPDVFLHRCGRTARANNTGEAILFLTKHNKEIDYVDFMKVKGVLMNKLDDIKVPKHHPFQAKLRDFILSDRANHDLALRAYVGYIKYYSKHVASSIFRMALLDYINLAKMYGLLRLPKMPETKYISQEHMPNDGWLGEIIDMDKYAYADKQREASRVANLESDKVKKIEDSKRRKELKAKHESWSNKNEKKETKQEKRQKIQRKREAIEQQIMDESEEEETQVDWKEMVRNNKKQKNQGNVQGSFDDL